MAKKAWNRLRGVSTGCHLMEALRDRAHTVLAHERIHSMHTHMIMRLVTGHHQRLVAT